MTETTIQSLWREYHVPFHIIQHMKKVAAVSIFIAEKLNQNGNRLNRELVKQGSLLHDFVKVCDLKKIEPENFQGYYSKEDFAFWLKLRKKYENDGHELAGYKILKKLGENQLALIVKKHRYSCIIDPKLQERPESFEEKIVYYADKRVKHDQIVSIEERIHDGHQRYYPAGNIPSNDKFIQLALKKLEEELCQTAKILPQAINETHVKKYLVSYS